MRICATTLLLQNILLQEKKQDCQSPDEMDRKLLTTGGDLPVCQRGDGPRNGTAFSQFML